MKKFELTTEQKINWLGRTLYRIRACISFTTTSGDEVKAGDLGGFVEKESNLSHNGKAWVWGNAKVWGNAEVCGDAEVWGNAKVWGNAEVCGDAKVCGDAEVCGDAKVCGDASVFSTKHIFCITPIGKHANSLTLFRTKHLEIKVSFECEEYTISEFEEMMKEDEWDNNLVSVAEGVIEVAKNHIDLTPEKEEFKPCPFCGGEADHQEDSEVVTCQKCGACAPSDKWNQRV